MRQSRDVVVLLSLLVSLAARPVTAQIATTGPAALARQMPTVYGPYLANISRVQILSTPGQRPSADRTASPRSSGHVPAGRQPRPPASPAGTPAAPQDTTFRTVRPAFVPQQLAARLGKTPQERQDITAILTRCLNFYTDTARQKGIPLNDVARALTYFIATNYFVYTEGSGPTPCSAICMRMPFVSRTRCCTWLIVTSTAALVCPTYDMLLSGSGV